MNTPHQEKTKHTVKESVLDRIEHGAVTPVARWVFVARNALFWGLWGGAVLIGAAALAAMAFSAEHAGWEFYEATHENFWTFAIEALPYFWIGLLVVVLVVGQYNLRHTKRGYRYAPHLVVLLSIGASTLCGAALYAAGTATFIEHTIGELVPFNHSVITAQRTLWDSPADGRLIGALTKPGDPELIFRDSEGETWQLVIEEARERDEALLRLGDEVRLIGYRGEASGVNEPIFHVCVVLPGVRPDSHEFFESAMFDRRKEFISWVRGELTEDERKVEASRTSECEGVRPHRLLQKDST